MVEGRRPCLGRTLLVWERVGDGWRFLVGVSAPGRFKDAEMLRFELAGDAGRGD